jgi:hypothetical protein
MKGGVMSTTEKREKICELRKKIASNQANLQEAMWDDDMALCDYYRELVMMYKEAIKKLRRTKCTS